MSLADPVAAPFALLVTLIVPSAMLNVRVTLPATMPHVIETVRLAIKACPAPDRTDVSDSHVVRSHAVSPTRTDGQYVASPNLAPAIVTLADPVDATLLL